MKHITSLLLIILSYSVSWSQNIPTITSIVPKQQEIAVYDSLRNICSENAQQLVGQELFFAPCILHKQDGNYNLDILTSYPTGSEVLSINRDGSNVYQPYTTSYGAIRTSYAGVVQKTFKITDYIVVNDGLGHPWPYLVLEDPLTDNPLYLSASSIYENKSSLLILGYFQKLKQQYVGQKFLTGTYGARLTRLSDNKLVSTNLPDTVSCIDITLLDKQWSPLALVLQGNDNVDYYIELNDSKHFLANVAERERRAAERAERNQARERDMTNKYGPTNGRLIAQGKVKIGFTKQMCIDAWGEPRKVNTTTTRYGKREQWVYYDSYLYFENGKLTSIQN